MKKILFSVVIAVLLLSVVAFAAGTPSAAGTPWDSSKNVKITLAESFSDRDDGKITWDDGKAGFWTSTAFYEWPEAKWENGQIVFTKFAGLKDGGDTRMTFRIQTNEIQNVSAAGSVGVGFYVENNTSRVQSIGFYMIGSGCCLKNEAGSKILFVSKKTGRITEFTATDKDMAMIPAGEKGWVLSFYDQFTNLWSSAPYDPANDPIRMPGFELTNLIIDESKGETVIIDNVFFFGENCVESYKDIVLNGGSLAQPEKTATATTQVTKKPEQTVAATTKEPEQTQQATQEPVVTEQPTAAPVQSEEATEQPTAAPVQSDEAATQPITSDIADITSPSCSGDTFVYIMSVVILVAAVVASVMILRKK